MSRIDSDKINFGESFVIKIEQDPLSGVGKLETAIKENNIKALSIIENAKQEAINIVNEAKQRAEQEALAVAQQIKETAQSEGFEAGFQEGKQQGLDAINQQFNEKINIFNSFVENSFEIKKRIIKSTHLDIVNLVLTISEKICHKKLELDNDILLKITQAAINELKEKENITIVVNPQIREKLFEILEQIKNENALISNIKITEDLSLSPDGAIVEGLNSRIDSRISSQIEEMTLKLLTTIKTQPEEELVRESDELFSNPTINPEKTEDIIPQKISETDPEEQKDDFT